MGGLGRHYANSEKRVVWGYCLFSGLYVLLGQHADGTGPPDPQSFLDVLAIRWDTVKPRPIAGMLQTMPSKPDTWAMIVRNSLAVIEQEERSQACSQPDHTSRVARSFSSSSPHCSLPRRHVQNPIPYAPRRRTSGPGGNRSPRAGWSSSSRCACACRGTRSPDHSPGRLRGR